MVISVGETVETIVEIEISYKKSLSLQGLMSNFYAI